MQSAVEHVEKGNASPQDVALEDWSSPARQAQPQTAQVEGRRSTEEEPEVAGLEPTRSEEAASAVQEATRFAQGSVAQLISGRQEPSPSSRTGGSFASSKIMSRVDVVDQAIRNRGIEPSTSSSASGRPPSGSPRSAEPVDVGVGATLATGGALAGLRKAYQPPREAPSGVFGPRVPEPRARPPEETSEEGPDTAAVENAGTEEEWETIAKRTQEMAAQERANVGKVVKADEAALAAISWREVHQWILQLQISPEVLQPLKDQMMDDVRCGCMARRRSMSEIPGLDAKLNAEKDLVLMLKMTQFDFNTTVHFRMLRTLYFKLTRNKVCPMIGQHWEVMGFQHTDPRTDLNRSNGVLNVIYMFYFHSNYPDIFKSAFIMAQDGEQNYPLGCVCVNIAKMVVDCLLAGRLSALCNSSDRGVFDTTCAVFAGGFFHWYSQWKSQKRSIRDTDQTFKEVEALMTRRPAKLIEGLAKGVQDLKARSDPSRLAFTSLDFGGGSGARPAGSSQGDVPSRLRNYQTE